MKHSEKITPIAAAAGAMTTLICCLPVTFGVAAAAGSLSAVVAGNRVWFLGASAVLLAVGVVQTLRRRGSCAARTLSSRVVLAISCAIVLLVIFFPQVVATLLADLLP